MEDGPASLRSLVYISCARFLLAALNRHLPRLLGRPNICQRAQYTTSTPRGRTPRHLRDSHHLLLHPLLCLGIPLLPDFFRHLVSTLVLQDIDSQCLPRCGAPSCRIQLVAAILCAPIIPLAMRVTRLGASSLPAMMSPMRSRPSSMPLTFRIAFFSMSFATRTPSNITVPKFYPLQWAKISDRPGLR